jgi:hypothetical protein
MNTISVQRGPPPLKPVMRLPSICAEPRTALAQLKHFRRRAMAGRADVIQPRIALRTPRPHQSLELAHADPNTLGRFTRLPPPGRKAHSLSVGLTLLSIFLSQSVQLFISHTREMFGPAKQFYLPIPASRLHQLGCLEMESQAKNRPLGVGQVAEPQPVRSFEELGPVGNVDAD